MAGDSPIDAGGRGGHVPWERIEATLMAGALTARPRTDDDRFPTLTPTEDVPARLDQARAMLTRLDAYQRSLPSPSAAGEHERRLLDAIDAGDDDTMARLGLDAEYGWLDVVLTALVSGAPYVEIETVGPYAAYHRDDTGRVVVSAERIPADERAGIGLATLMRAMVADCESARIVSLFDDVNDPLTGAEIDEDDQLRYVVGMGRIFYLEGVLRPDDVPGRDFVLLRESRAGERVAELLERLRHSGVGTVEEAADGDVTFWPARPFIERLALNSANRSREFTRRGILLRRAGRPTCQALEAAGFLDPHNRHVVHLLVLDAKFAAQQDKTYTLLQALGIVRQDTHHNVFYDSARLWPETVVRVVTRLLERELRRLIAALESVGVAPRPVDPPGVSPAHTADAGRISTLLAPVLADVFGDHRVAAAVDVGTGTSLESAQVIAPYIAEHGRLTLVRSSRTRCENLARQFGQAPAPSRLAEITDVRQGSVFELADDAYDLVTSFVGPEPITTRRREFRVTVGALARALRSGGVLVLTRLVRLDEAPASASGSAICLTVDDVVLACQRAGLVATIHLATAEPVDGTTTALVVARHRR